MTVQRLHALRAQSGGKVRYLGASWMHAFGHIGLIDVIAKRRLLGLCDVRHIILAPAGAAVNVPFLTLWRDWFEIVTDADEVKRRLREAELLEDYPTVLDVNGEWKSIHEVASLVQEKWDAAARAPLMSLPQEYEVEGRDALAQLGMPRDAWFVTLHVRDDGSECLRNGNLIDYQDAVRRITDSGGWVVRMGGPSAPPLGPMERVIDYASLNTRNEVLDVFLLARPRFFLGNNSGPAHAAGIFGVPALLTNWAPIGLLSWHAQNVTVPKLICHRRNGQLLPFAEQLSEPLGVLEYPRMLHRRGLRSLKNSTDQIAAAVDEMLNRTARARRPDADDERRQARFQHLQQKCGAVGRSAIGRSFLRQHEQLLS